MPIRAITFDLDNTLWHIGDAIRHAERETYAYLTRHCPDLEEHYDIPALRELMLELLAEQPDLTHQISRLRKLALERAIRQSGYSEAQAQIHSEAAFDIFLHGRHRVTLFDHALEVLEELHQRYRIGALTNGNADVARLAVGPYFDFSFSAEEFLSNKPHPKLFNAALEHTGLKPSECIHVGDHHEHDIFGAQQAGFYTVWVNIERGEWPGGIPASAEVNSLNELPRAIAAIEKLAATSD